MSIVKHKIKDKIKKWLIPLGIKLNLNLMKFHKKWDS